VRGDEQLQADLRLVSAIGIRFERQGKLAEAAAMVQRERMRAVQSDEGQLPKGELPVRRTFGADPDDPNQGPFE
jgi:hypothetical protein